MAGPSTPERDDIADLLQAPPVPTGTDRLRQVLRERTASVLLRRRRLKWLGLVAALAACYLAGAASMVAWLSSRTEAPAPQARLSETPPTPRLPERAPSAASAELSAMQLERASELTEPEKRSALYRRAGDLYLEAHGDVQAALRCYRLALEAGSEKDLALAPEDNWLLISLKNERQKEKRHVPNDS